MFRSLTRRTALALLACAAIGGPAAAQAAYPDQPIKWVVGFPPGGGTDTLARTVAAQLATQLDQRIVVENRAGASGAIAAQSVARANPDGYTLLTADIAILALNPPIYTTSLQYDAARDFTPIGLMAQFPLLIATHPNSGIDSMNDLLQALRAGKAIHYGSAGVGTPHHLAMEALLAGAGGQAVHVPYKGDSPALQDLAGGQVPVAVLAPSLALPYVQAGKLKPLAVTAEKRFALLPEVPTLVELGVTTDPVHAWQGLVAPRGTPEAVVAQLSSELQAALAAPAVIEKLASLGMEPIGGDGAAMHRYVTAQQDFWRRLIESRQIRAD